MITPVILSGGNGTRLWPLSRKHSPKQFLKLHGDHTMFQETLLRLAGLPQNPAVVVCNNAHRFTVAEQVQQIHHEALILLEPVGRNTAPAVTLAALKTLEINPESLLLVLPADHIIEDTSAFQAVINRGEEEAHKGNIVTFGIMPDRAHTGYGYIQQGEQLSEQVFTIAGFKEKPEQHTAESYIASGEYSWNSGMFMFRADVFIEEMEKFSPETVSFCRESLASSHTDLDFIRIEEANFSACTDISLDYALMEKTGKGVVIPLDAGWNDLGAWCAAWETGEQDEQRNVCRGDVIAIDSEDCYLRSENRLVAAIGMENHIVVETADAVLVAPKERAQDVKLMVNRLKTEQREEASFQTVVDRPWGSYESIAMGDRFQVKRIIVKPGERLSLQKHHHRAEHWIVVNGTAEVTCGEKTVLLTENESTYIPLGDVHRLYNPGKVSLVLIEVQSGSYLGEDDIVRLDDVYGR